MPLERDAILSALHRTGGNIGKAARELGASRRTLQNRMREYGLPPGKSGRRKRLLPYAKRSRSLEVGIGVGALAGVIMLGRYFARKAPTV